MVWIINQLKLNKMETPQQLIIEKVLNIKSFEIKLPNPKDENSKKKFDNLYTLLREHNPTGYYLHLVRDTQISLDAPEGSCYGIEVFCYEKDFDPLKQAIQVIYERDC